VQIQGVDGKVSVCPQNYVHLVRVSRGGGCNEVTQEASEGDCRDIDLKALVRRHAEQAARHTGVNLRDNVGKTVCRVFFSVINTLELTGSTRTTTR
jgi:hypothetical protein